MWVYDLQECDHFMDCLINEYWIFRELYVNSYFAIK
jgi:hypothetical protein